MTLGAVLLLSLAFVLLNGVFVAAEFALIGAPKPVLERRSAEGHWVAKHLLRVLSSARRQDRYVGTSQLGITLASLGLGMYGEHALAVMLEPSVEHLPVIGGATLAMGLALGFLTILHIVLGEMVPKGLALKNPEGVAMFTHWPMQVTLVLLYPLVAISGVMARLCLRAVGIKREHNAHDQVYTPDELQLIVAESEKGGVLRSESGKILRELFEFGDLAAAQVMVPRVRVVGIPVGATSAELKELVITHRRTRYAVYDGDLDHIVGMVHVKDLLRRLMNDEGLSAPDIRRIPVVPTTASLDVVLETMQRRQAHIAVVIDEHGGTAGIVSLEDLFEEVVGEIDEGMPSAPALVREADGSVRALGTMRLDELGQHFDLDLEHDEVESVSGLVLERLGRPPMVGDVVEYGRIRMEVTAILGRGVGEVRARLT
ncbi:MAG: hemolysin family protein [Acidobacteriota bacterium]